MQTCCFTHAWQERLKKKMSFIFFKVLNLTILFLLLFQIFMCKDIGALSTLQIEPLLTLFYIMVVTKNQEL